MSNQGYKYNKAFSLDAAAEQWVALIFAHIRAKKVIKKETSKLDKSIPSYHEIAKGSTARSV